MKKIALILMLVSGGAYAANITSMPPRLDQFAKNLNTVSASFKQIKMIPESDKKFNATGRVKFQKGTGFIWFQDTPVKQLFVSTMDKYCVDGVTKNLNSLPYFYYVRQVIDDVLNGDIAGLQTVFKVDYTEYGKNLWQLTATPRFDAVADFLQDIVVYGSTTDLTKVIITYNDGTVIIIQFNRMSTEIADEIVC